MLMGAALGLRSLRVLTLPRVALEQTMLLPWIKARGVLQRLHTLVLERDCLPAGVRTLRVVLLGCSSLQRIDLAPRGVRMLGWALEACTPQELVVKEGADYEGAVMLSMAAISKSLDKIIVEFEGSRPSALAVVARAVLGCLKLSVLVVVGLGTCVWVEKAAWPCGLDIIVEDMCFAEARRAVRVVGKGIVARVRVHGGDLDEMEQFLEEFGNVKMVSVVEKENVWSREEGSANRHGFSVRDVRSLLKRCAPHVAMDFRKASMLYRRNFVVVEMEKAASQ